MSTLIQRTWQSLMRRNNIQAGLPEVAPPKQASQTRRLEVEITPDDPILAYFQTATGVVELDRLELDSPALRSLKEAGVKLSVPLVGQGELIGLLNLGPRLSEQEYSTDDHRLLNNLATQAAPAVRVAQLVRQQQAEALERERLEQELRVARIIQKTLLPKEVPALPGWRVSAYWQPAFAVSGDFYDFLSFPDGRLGIIIGDVTDKGVPAALVMATTRSILRATTERLSSPGEVLERVNNLLCPDIPPNMFVTCLYAVLDPASGQFRFANAGHCLPYRRGEDGVHELRATGMPLGLLPDMAYEEKETTLMPGDSLLFYSDGLVEAHDPQGEMFGTPRLKDLLCSHPGGPEVIDFLLGELSVFVGVGWEQEDDTTFLVLERSGESSPLTPLPGRERRTDALSQIGERAHSTTSEGGSVEGGLESEGTDLSAYPLSQSWERGPGGEGDWRTLAEFSLPSEPGTERQAAERVAQVVQALSLPAKRLAQLTTAVAEATMNAMEHGNQYRADLPVVIEVLASDSALAVRISDLAQGGAQPIPDPTMPDLEAKLAGLQTPRGWGLFLIEKMVDEMRVTSDDHHHTIELILFLQGGDHDRQTS